MKFFNLAFVSVFAFISLISASDTLAACGNIITTVNYGDGPIEEFSPIEDCDNPFNADSPNPFTYNLTLGFSGQLVTENSVITINESGTATGTFSINKGSNFSFEPLSFFQKVGDDYEQVSSVTFLNGSDFAIDALVEGEYVAVLKFELPPVLQVEATPLWKQFLIKLLQPQVANAYYEDYVEIVAVPFTIKYESIEVPAGASSVLFLPGIQASRLYTKGVFGTENQLWEPNVNADVEKLAMTDEGVSIYDIYTKDVIDEVNVLPVAQGNIYKGFLRMLEDLKGDEVVKDFASFPYDWRYSVFDVATKEVLYEDESKKLLDEVLALADDSYTGKVTLIGHSNGGLVAKALLYEYGEAELAGKIDKMIMIGTPQLGTPKAIGSMLHGLDQSIGSGIIATASTVRQITKNLAGAYTLLPSPKYFEEISEPMITTDGSLLSEAVSAYGDIDSSARLHSFLINSLDNRDGSVGLNEPIALNPQMLLDTIGWQSILDNWGAPEGVDVYEVVGTGLATIKGYDYREYGCKESHPDCVLHSYLKPFPIMSNDGDQTVTEISAAAYEGDKILAVVNLYDASFLKPKTHANLTESGPVQDFIGSVIKYPYLSDSIIVPEYTGVSSRYRIIAAFSPVSLLAVDDNGRQVGMIGGEIKEEIYNAQYFELGGSKFLVLPSEVNVNVKVTGVDDGIYSLSVDEIDESGKQVQISILKNSTTSVGMTAEFSVKDGEYSPLETDQDGDGEIDLIQSLNGEIILEPEVVYNYGDLRIAVKDLKLTKQQEKKILLKVGLAELFAKKSQKKKVFVRLEARALKLVLLNLKKLERKGIIDGNDVRSIEVIINNLQ
ncbi:hypothetical protein KC926_01565 [Candidatus Kaiserbacteria bacterium]|nr:hypothetical protein [Candidatus Kaiserbacteria bacterium]